MQIDCSKVVYYIFFFFPPTCYGYMLWFLISEQVLQASGKSEQQ